MIWLAIVFALINLGAIVLLIIAAKEQFKKTTNIQFGLSNILLQIKHLEAKIVLADPRVLLSLRDKLEASAHTLRKAVAQVTSITHIAIHKGKTMPSTVLQELEAQVTANIDAEMSAVLLINGIADRVVDAVEEALKNGATAEELEPVKSQIAAMKASADALAAAVLANTPASKKK